MIFIAFREWLISLTSFFFLVSYLLFFSLHWESFDTWLPSLLPFVICVLLIPQTEQSYSYLHFSISVFLPPTQQRCCTSGSSDYSISFFLWDRYGEYKYGKINFCLCNWKQGHEFWFPNQFFILLKFIKQSPAFLFLIFWINY